MSRYFIMTSMKIREAQIFSDKVVDLIGEEMKKRQISRYLLAQITQLSEPSLSFIFHHQRRPTLYTLIRITNALNISLSDIIAQIEKDFNE